MDFVVVEMDRSFSGYFRRTVFSSANKQIDHCTDQVEERSNT